jgi:glycosyltransferase involved in cell wall biosynthesis
MSSLKTPILITLELFILPLLLILAVIARIFPKKVDVGFGPEPLINNIYHAKSLRLQEISAESFVESVYYITSDFDRKLIAKNRLISILSRLVFFTFIFSIFRYRILYIYFNGGGLYLSRVLWILEPFLYKIAGVKTVVMPYGSDVQDLTKTRNILFKQAVILDYPLHYKKIFIIKLKVWLWENFADHVISGCDWIEYMSHWDSLCISHFSIDLERWTPPQTSMPENTLNVPTTIKILHAPNHRNIKGSNFFVEAINKLKSKGLPVELIIIERSSNDTIKKKISECDIVADQMIIGWYAMFAIEGMAMQKPVLCNVRQDFEAFYIHAGLLDRDELPLVRCTPENLEDKIVELVQNPSLMKDIGLKGRRYVEKHHSLKHIGSFFSEINSKLTL